MGAIKNFYHEEICKREFDRFEDSEHFNNYKQIKAVKPKHNGKDIKNNKNSIQK